MDFTSWTAATFLDVCGQPPSTATTYFPPPTSVALPFANTTTANLSPSITNSPIYPFTYIASQCDGPVKETGCTFFAGISFLYFVPNKTLDLTVATIVVNITQAPNSTVTASATTQRDPAAISADMDSYGSAIIPPSNIMQSTDLWSDWPRSRASSAASPVMANSYTYDEANEYVMTSGQTIGNILALNLKATEACANGQTLSTVCNNGPQFGYWENIAYLTISPNDPAFDMRTFRADQRDLHIPDLSSKVVAGMSWGDNCSALGYGYPNPMYVVQTLTATVTNIFGLHGGSSNNPLPPSPVQQPVPPPKMTELPDLPPYSASGGLPDAPSQSLGNMPTVQAVPAGGLVAPTAAPTPVIIPLHGSGGGRGGGSGGSGGGGGGGDGGGGNTGPSVVYTPGATRATIDGTAAIVSGGSAVTITPGSGNGGGGGGTGEVVVSWGAAGLVVSSAGSASTVVLPSSRAAAPGRGHASAKGDTDGKGLADPVPYVGVVTVGGQAFVYTRVAGETTLVLGGTTLTLGAKGTTIAGQVVSLKEGSTDGIVVVGASSTVVLGQGGGPFVGLSTATIQAGGKSHSINSASSSTTSSQPPLTTTTKKPGLASGSGRIGINCFGVATVLMGWWSVVHFVLFAGSL